MVKYIAQGMESPKGGMVAGTGSAASFCTVGWVA